MQGRARWLLLLGAAAVAVILFFVLRPGSDNGSSTSTTIDITITDGRPVDGIAKATVRKGEQVALVVHSDVSDEVHLHGYDLHKDVEAGGTARIDFTANITGRFEAELESRQEQILDLTVEP